MQEPVNWSGEHCNSSEYAARVAWAAQMREKNLYYARTGIFDDEVAIFETEEMRDRWVDAKSRSRIALTRKQARECAGSALDMPMLWKEDCGNAHIYWAG